MCASVCMYICATSCIQPHRLRADSRRDVQTPRQIRRSESAGRCTSHEQANATICMDTINNLHPRAQTPYLRLKPLILSFNPSTLLPNFSSSLTHPRTWLSGLVFLDFHPLLVSMFEISTILGLIWKFVISRIKIFDSVSRDCRVGVIGVEGGDVSESEDGVGDRPGTPPSPSSSSLALSVGSDIGKEGIWARSLRSGYRCRDFNNEFSDLKYRIADRRFSTCTSASSYPELRYIPAQRVGKPPIPHPSAMPIQQQEVKTP
jgi:hypothetical protein